MTCGTPLVLLLGCAEDDRESPKRRGSTGAIVDGTIGGFNNFHVLSPISRWSR